MTIDVVALHSAAGRKTRRAGMRARANVTIEMVLILPMVLALIFGMIEFAQFFYIKSAFEAAARDAARVACTTIAAPGDPASAATRALACANVTFQPAWMTIYDQSTSTTVSDVSAIAAGHAFTVTIQKNYEQIPNVYRPLYDMTGQGIRNGKLVVGKCTMIKE